MQGASYTCCCSCSFVLATINLLFKYGGILHLRMWYKGDNTSQCTYSASADYTSHELKISPLATFYSNNQSGIPDICSHSHQMISPTCTYSNNQIYVGTGHNGNVMLSKNTLGVKMCKAKQKQHCGYLYMWQKSLISTDAKKLRIYQKSFYLLERHAYNSLQCIFTTMIGFVTWPTFLYHITIKLQYTYTVYIYIVLCMGRSKARVQQFCNNHIVWSW